jgi:ubiquinone/menaquinone biosynthesis C-methylase UbiE
MEFRELQKSWAEWGRKDPFFAVLSLRDKKYNRWNEEEFFETGRREIAHIMEYVAALPSPPPYTRALDFGCGVGRLSQPLCSYFRECHGVDIAPTMLRLANRYNRRPDCCHFHLNERSDLKLFPDGHFSFVYSHLVLQHMRPEYAEKYIGEFVRLLCTGGIALFQIPSHRTDPEPSKAARLISRAKEGIRTVVNSVTERTAGYLMFPKQEAYGTSRERVADTVEGAGGRIVEVRPEKFGLGELGWANYFYTVTK